jgi:hypothetical protein
MDPIADPTSQAEFMNITYKSAEDLRKVQFATPFHLTSPRSLTIISGSPQNLHLLFSQPVANVEVVRMNPQSLEQPRSPDQPVTQEQLNALMLEVQALQGALANARLLRIGMLLGAIVVVATMGWMMLHRFREFTSEHNLNRLATVASDRLEKKKDFYMRQFEQLTNKVSPAISQAFLDQARKDMPLYLKAIEKEKEPFIGNLQKKFADRLDRRYAKLKPDMEALLKKEFPELKDDKLHAALVNNLDKGMHQMLQKYYVEDLKNEVDTLYKTWDKFPPAPLPTKGQPALETQFLDSLFDLMVFKLSHYRKVASR